MSDETHRTAQAPPDPLEKAGNAKPSLLGTIGKLFGRARARDVQLPATGAFGLSETVRIPWGHDPFELKLGAVALECHPDLAVTGEEIAGEREWIIHPGAAFHADVPLFVRLSAGQTLVLGRSMPGQSRILRFDHTVSARHVSIANTKGWLTLQPLEIEQPTTLARIAAPTHIWAARHANLMRLPEVLGRALVPFDDTEALEVANEVIAILDEEAYRDRDDDEVPGGVIQLPDDMTVIIFGDIHARANNVLRVITEGGTLAALERGTVCLVFLGDVVHSQETDELDDMDSSIFILDLFFMLKRRFPKNVFYVHGNHESFSEEVGKGGVPQGLLFRKHLKKRRGKAFVNAVQSLFDHLAFVVQGNEFAACHGAPVRSTVTRETLVNIRRYPGLQSELVWNRLRRSNRPAGYSKGSVKRFRRTLGLPKHAPVVVAHTPLSTIETVWIDVDGITGHHVIYSAHTHRLAVLVMRAGKMTPLEFRPEQSLAVLDAAREAPSA